MIRRNSKGIFLLLLLCPYLLLAQQKQLSIPQKSYSLGQLFALVENQAGGHFQYDARLMDLSKKVHMEYKGDLRGFLRLLAEKESLVFQMRNDRIAVRKQEQIVLRGKVLNEAGEPIPYATVSNMTENLQVSSNAQGQFVLPLVKPGEEVLIRLAHVGMQTEQFQVSKSQWAKEQRWGLKTLSLNLEQVDVVAMQGDSLTPASTIIFGREAIEQTQAFSLGDLLNQLPGKVTAPPNLQAAQQLTLRSNFVGGSNANSNLNNAFGTAFILDGLALSTDADMQNRNVGKYGMAGSDFGGRDGVFEVPFGGVDLRNIAVDNVEKIEVIQGVASAKYGNLTDGAVVIERQAGVLPYQFAVRINGASTNYSLSKGYMLGNKWGALNVNGNYVNSIDDPRNALKTYRRYGTGLMWTVRKGEWLKNTFSFDYGMRQDRQRVDEEDTQRRSAYSTQRSIGLRNRTTINVSQPWLHSVGINLGYSDSKSSSQNQWQFNKSPIPISGKDTTGIYEGYFVNGNFLAMEQVEGRPVSFNANLDASNTIYTGSMRHRLEIGASYQYSDNIGRGVIVDPERPRWQDRGMQNERPYSYDIIPALQNWGLYMQDAFEVKIADRTLNSQIGLRYDIQNGFGTWQPRISSTYSLSKHWSMHAAYGLATKAPSMAHRYPMPIYFDVELLSRLDNVYGQSIVMYQTEKIVPDNSDLKPSKSHQFNLGLNGNYRDFSTSLALYYKRNLDGFTTNNIFNPIWVPGYEAYTDENGQVAARPIADSMRLVHNYGYNEIGNDLYSESSGLQWSINVDRIPALQTSFNLVTTFDFSYFKNAMETARSVEINRILNGATAYYGVYRPNRYQAYNLMSKLNSTTHIPRLGLVVNLMVDFFWLDRQKSLGQYQQAIAYLDGQMVRHDIPVFDPANEDYNYLVLASDEASNTRSPFAYANLSMGLAKEIKKKIRIGLRAYNVLNMRHEYYNPATGNLTTYVYPFSMTGEIAIKF